MKKLFIVFFVSLGLQTQAQRASIAGVKPPVGDSIMAQLKRSGFSSVPGNMYLRGFKYEKQLEVWMKEDTASKYRLFKTYKVCTQSGTMGPKRMEGDYQVPEGIYYINEYNPNSAFHLSLGLNYPNASDRILSDKRRPGSAIYVHGNCVSTGCIPLTDQYVEELYSLASMVRQQGEQEFIPIHVFPIKYSVKKSSEYLGMFTAANESLLQFNTHLRQVYDYFEKYKTVPIVMVNAKGDYVVNSR